MDYLHFGKAGGEKLVILPGLSLKSVLGSSDAIVSAYSPLAGDYGIWLPDHIHEEPEGYTIEGMAEDTLAAFDRLGIGQAHLMGVSMGGMVSQAAAVLAPDRVSSLILCSTAMSAAHSDPALFGRWKTLAEALRCPCYTYEGYGHAAYDEAPDYLLRVGDFLRGCTKGHN